MKCRHLLAVSLARFLPDVDAVAAAFSRNQGASVAQASNANDADDAEAVIREAESVAAPLNGMLQLDPGEAAGGVPPPAPITKPASPAQEQQPPSGIAPMPSPAASPAPAAEARQKDADDDGDDDDDEPQEGEQQGLVAPPPTGAVNSPGPTRSLGRGAGVASPRAAVASRWKEDVGKVTPETRRLLPGTAYEKAGKVVATRKLIVENRLHQETLQKLSRDLSDKDAFARRVDHEVTQAGLEAPQHRAVAEVLGKMWKDMRKYGSPFFLEHVEGQQEWLKKREPELQKELDDAKAELRGHYHKLVVEADPLEGLLRRLDEEEKSVGLVQAVPSALLLLALLLAARA